MVRNVDDPSMEIRLVIKYCEMNCFLIKVVANKEAVYYFQIGKW